jgi:hypothetical protein
LFLDFYFTFSINKSLLPKIAVTLFILHRPCPRILMVNEGKADPETLGDAKWNWRSREQRGLRKIWRERSWTGWLGKMWL